MKGSQDRYGILWKSLCFTVVAGIFFTGCQGSVINYPGDRIRDGSEIWLHDRGQQTGQYQTEDLTVQYWYAVAGDKLQISGAVHFAGGFQTNFSTIRFFNLSLILADIHGMILQSHGLVSTSAADSADPLNFSITIQVPSQTAGFAFSYTGQATATGDESESPTDFWDSPIVR